MKTKSNKVRHIITLTTGQYDPLIQHHVTLKMR